ncbi:MAG: FtsK/SpoIIIE domain-containing protein [Dermatophilaceae bacterium]
MAGSGAVALAGHSQWAVPALVLGVGGGVVTVVAGQRTKARHDLHDRLVEALAPYLGVRQLDRRTVQLRAWTRGWPGLPRRILVRYAPGAPDSDPSWRASIVEVVNARLLGIYRVAVHDRSKCRLILVPATDAPANEPPHCQVRAQRAITELIGPTATVTGCELDGGQLRSITVTHQAGAKLAAGGYRARVERVISTMLPGRWRAVWDLEGDSVRFELRPFLPGSVWLPGRVPDNIEDLLANYRQVRIPFGVDEDGQELAWFPARTPHVLLTGTTGSGKTSAGHALVAQVAAHGWPVWVGDSKRVEFLEFRDWPNVQVVAGSIPAQVALIHRAWELMEHRYELIESARARVVDFEPLFVVLDEYAEFVAGLSEWYPMIKVRGEPTKPPTVTQVASLLRKARTARIHLLITMQRPDVALLGGPGGEMRDNLGHRVSMGRLSPQGAMMMWENPAVGVSLPRGCIGRATATHDDGRPVEMQCYRFPSWDAAAGTEEHALLARLRPAQARHPRLLIAPAQDGQNEQAGPATFRDYATTAWVLASARPDLDPLSERNVVAAVAGRDLSSTLASLGLHHLAGPDYGASLLGVSHRLEPSVDAMNEAADADDPDQWAASPEVDQYPGYAPETTTSVVHLVPGDLIRLDDADPDAWVVVDEPPEEDLADPGGGLIAVSWRGDGDESGSLSIPDGTRIVVRRPEEFS